MDMRALLAVFAVILAIYALARPPQRRSIELFVPTWLVLGALGLSTLMVIGLQILTPWQASLCWVTIVLSTVAFLVPVVTMGWAAWSWHKAELTKKEEPLFRAFLRSCLSDGLFDEAVRILTRNHNRLADVLDSDTLYLVFDRRFVRAMISADSWMHLEMLTNVQILKKLGYCHRAVDRVLRELLAADESPLRASALQGEGADETLHVPNDEQTLIDRTFMYPAWYHLCRAGYPVLLAAVEHIDSGDLDQSYNRPTGRYGATQGVADRSRCIVFLAEKTIAHALGAAIKRNEGTKEDTHRDAADLWDLFRTILEHSKYDARTWDEPFGCGDYPTPFGFLLAEILHDYDFICQEAWNASDYGKRLPPDILAPVVGMWAHCVMWFTKDEGHVSPRFRARSVCTLLEMALERRQTEVNTKDYPETRAAWTRVFVDSIKGAMTSWLPDSRAYLGQVLQGMDPCKDHISRNREWLSQELGISTSAGAVR